ncbi:uncharacterized protein LOC113686968 [Pocillopora damicornis]|uniref:Uncharacterized protein n=1 Tax=Pocillopora meandrina TaxID=46732 RepID=A0AAU9XYF3_9CNID|nr:uncharacterized protein LOC113686968 [Pocillopora damicornis]CAH3159659.1 unnamed protein product [Pocillopora meandrina]
MIIRGFVLLLFVALISSLVKEHGRSDGSKHEFEDSAFSSKTIPREIHHWIRFDGDWYNCHLERSIDSHGVFCSCPFLACTGYPHCFGLKHCKISKRYDYLNIKKEECKCRRFY